MKVCLQFLNFKKWTMNSGREKANLKVNIVNDKKVK